MMISNPCTSTDSWTCDSTVEGGSLRSTIFKTVFRMYYWYATCHTFSSIASYSFQINHLNRNYLWLTCWNGAGFTGGIATKKAEAFANNYLYPSLCSCRWEGFIWGIGGDVEFIFSSTGNAKLWIKYDSTPAPAISCTSCNRYTYRMRMVNSLFYYIRMDVSNTLNITLKYKILPSGTEQDIKAENMFQPIRMNMGIITGTAINLNYTVSSNNPENGIYYCSPICASCNYSPIGIRCTACIDKATLNDGKCSCVANMLYNDEFNECEKFPALSTACAYTGHIMGCSSCVANASVKDINCECNSGYYEDITSNSCMSNACKISFILYKGSEYSYTDTLLEISNPCSALNGVLCEDIPSTKRLATRKLINFTNSDLSISASYDIAGDSPYTISIINLKSGNLLLETFPYSDWTGSPSYSNSTLELNLSDTNGKSYRLQGYLKVTESRLYQFSIDTNANCKIYFDFLDKPWVIPGVINYRFYYLTANKYYYLRIDILGTASDLNFKIITYIPYSNVILNTMLYYPVYGSILRWNITSCDNSINAKRWNHDLRYCPLLCKTCNIRINRSTTANNEICDSCVDNSALNSDGICVCNSRYYQSVQECLICPNTCMTCNNNLSCNSCIPNAAIINGKCVCNDGYYLDTSAIVSCNKCPDGCTTCTLSLTTGVVQCNTCIEHGVVESNLCVCKGGYYPDTTSEYTCKKCPDGCTLCGYTSGNLVCSSCILNATVQADICKCNAGYYLNTNIECANCPDLCESCNNTSGSIACDTCIQNSKLDSLLKCICKAGYYFDNRSGASCKKCPNLCTSCILSGVSIQCVTCVTNGMVESSICKCNSGFYYDNSAVEECKKCPDGCTTCSYISGKVVCHTCIENARIQGDICECDSGYFLSTSITPTCYAIGEYCTVYHESSGQVICTSCVENAILEGSICKCNDTYYGVRSAIDECIKCPDPCSNCNKVNPDVQCLSCIDNYYLSHSNPGVCMECPRYCAECLDNSGTITCNKCMNDLVLISNECKCQIGYGIDTSSITCKKCPDLSHSCEYNDSSISYLVCIENTFKLENNCYCNRDYIADTICSPLDCSIDISIQSNSEILLLDLVQDCDSNDRFMCNPPYYRRTQVYKKDAIRMIKNRNYYLHILSLEKGGLSFKYWNSSNIIDTPNIDSKEDLSYDLSNYIDGIARYEGYITLPQTGFIGFIIDTNNYNTVYLQDDRNILLKYTTTEFSGYFTQGEYYFIRIEFPVVSNSYIKMIGYSYDLYFEISSDYLYYPTILKDSPVFIASSFCEQSKPLDPIDNSPSCPDQCNRCDKSTASSETVACSECRNSEYSTGSMCRCKHGFYYNSKYDRCDTPYCGEYNVEKVCIECIDYFILKEGRCLCEGEDYEMGNDVCTPKEFRLEIVTHTNRIDIVFSKYLKLSLNKDDITVNIQDTDISSQASYELKTIADNLSYSLEFKYPDNINTQLTTILTLSPTITDRQNISLSTSTYYITFPLLFEYPATTNEPEEVIYITPKVAEYRQASRASTAAVGSTTVGLSFINLSPNLLLSMLSTLQIFSFIPLMNINLPNKVRGVCLGFEAISIFPNLMYYFISLEGKEINSRYTNYGYRTSQFLINSGSQISVLIQISGSYIILKLLDKMLISKLEEGRIKRVHGKILGMFEYGMFIGFIIQAYSEFFITSGMNVLYPEYNTYQEILSLILASITLASCILFPALLLLFLLKYADRFSEESFDNRFSTIYSFFDKDNEYFIPGILLTTIRKMIFSISILILDSSPYIQITINSVTSAGVLAFYVINNTFKERKDRYSEILIEICMFIALTCFSLLLHDWLRGDILEWTLLILLYASMGLPCAVNLIVLVLKLVQYCRNKHNSRRIIAKTQSKSHTSLEGCNQDHNINKEDSMIQDHEEMRSNLTIRDLSISKHSTQSESTANNKMFLLEQELSVRFPVQELREYALSIQQSVQRSQKP